MHGPSYSRISILLCLRLLLLLAGLLLRPTACWTVADCRGIDNHNFDDERSSNTSENCYCDPVAEDDDQRRVVVRCLLGSTIDTLAKTVDKVKAADGTVWSIQVGEMDFQGQRMRDNFFTSHNITPEEFSVFSCGTPERFTFSEASLYGVQDSLKKFTVFGCKLSTVPPVVRRLHSLEVLELASDEIESLRRGELAGLNQLRTLDLSDNNMLALDKGSLHGLRKLETLILGPGNSLSHIALQEVTTLPGLRQLKMPKNHLKTLPDNCFKGLDKLEELDLSGNFLENLTKPMFQGLSGLKTLDLRVNLISRIEDDAFSALTSLKELYLSGNYITEIRQGLFRNLVSLEALHLGWNEFADLEDNAFVDLPSLNSLQLNNNRKLMLIEDGAFNKLSKLDRLNLSSTKILTLEPETFRNTPELTVLDLSNSDIDLLDVNTFGSVPKLRELYLNKTHLFTLPDGLLAPLTQLRSIDLSFNPWQCNDNLTWLVDWVKTATPGVHINRIDDTICFWPTQLRGERLVSLDTSQMRRHGQSQTATTLRPDTAQQHATTKASGGFFGSILSTESDRANDVEEETLPSSERADGSQNTEVGTVIIVVVVILSLLIIVTVIMIVTMMMRKRRRGSANGKLKNGVDQLDRTQTYRVAGQQPVTVPYRTDASKTDSGYTNNMACYDSELITHF